MPPESNRPVGPVVPHPPLPDYYPEAARRREFLHRIFDATAVHYDWINRVMSLGSGIAYRRDALKRAGLEPGMNVLDVCTGSAQVARPARQIVGGTGSVLGLDASREMLRQARRALPMPVVQAYAEALPLAGSRFDFLSMGYALRHVSDLAATFREYRRVLRPGGRLLLIEFTRPTSPPLYWMARLYLRHVVPWMAGIGARSRDARVVMRYFWDTIESCVPPPVILKALAEAGFEEPARHVLAGIFSEYTARRPRAGNAGGSARP